MNFGRLFSMARKDIVLTTRESFFVLMLVMPILMTVVLNAALGTVGEETPVLGVYGDGLVELLEEEPSIEVVTVSSLEYLREKVAEGEYDAGLILPGPGGEGEARLLLSGESLLSERLTIGATLMNVYRKNVNAQERAVYEIRVVGGGEFSLKVRLIPFLLIVGTVIAGFIISSSLIEEREMKTLNAVLVTPITYSEVILAKSVYGLFLGLVLGVLILVLNSSFGGGMVVLFFLFLGTLFTVGLGLIAGAVMKNITDLIARIKIFNLFLMFPAFVVLFPQIPQWLGYFFPTYYYIDPILEVTQKGAGWSDVWWEAVVLVVIDVVVLIFAGRVLRERMLGKEIKI